MSHTTSILHSESLAQAWLRRVHRSEHAVAIHFDEQTWTYAQLQTRALSIVRQFDLRQLHKGDRVIILMDNGPSFIAAFFAAQLAGLIPVPISPRSSSERLAYVDADCAASLIVYDSSLSARTVTQHLTQSYAHKLLAISEIEQIEFAERAIPASPICAFIQYTSGSSGDAKGVMISHQAALNNIQSFTADMQLTEADAFSSMLPLFHDMGLLCFGLAPLLLGHPLWLYRAESLQLYRWLEDLERHKIAFTGAPDSLLQIACRVVGNAADSASDHTTHYQLSHLKMLICGSEPVRLETIREFGRRFDAAHAIAPAYGMAELSLCASLTAFPCQARVNDLGQVASGRAIHGVEIAIRDEQGRARAVGVPGEIMVRSPAAMMGYWGRPEATAQAFDDDAYLKTGDEGFLDQDGYLYVISRIKNLLIKSGEKYSAHQLESCIQGLNPVRRAAVIQSSLAHAQIYAVVELDRRLLNNFSELSQLERSIKRSCFEATGITPDVCGFVASGALPCTENGKLRHAALRNAIDKASFDAVWSYQLKEEAHAIALA